ncbi:MAG: hypothetical protein AAF802_01735 [Planctomycetota bacterium]
MVTRSPYTQGVESFGYRLTNEFSDDAIQWARVMNPETRSRLERLHREWREQNQERWRPEDHDLDRMQHSLKIDAEKALEIIATLTPEQKIGQRFIVDRIQKKAHRYSVCKQGRAHTSLGGVKREIRMTLSSNGERLFSVDIVNSQLAFLASILSGEAKKFNNTPTQDRTKGNTSGLKIRGNGSDGVYSLYVARPSGTVRGESGIENTTQDFIDLAASGQLYDELQRGTGLSRSRCKSQFMVDVLAKRGDYRRKEDLGKEPVESYFARRFPQVHRFIRRVNRDDHSILIRHLQRIESHFVIEVVCRLLLDRFPDAPIFTLHDALYTQASHIENVEQAFRDACEVTGVRLSTTTEPA